MEFGFTKGSTRVPVVGCLSDTLKAEIVFIAVVFRAGYKELINRGKSPEKGLGSQI